MQSFEKIIERMRTAISVYTDQDLAKYLGIAKTSVSSWRARQNIPRKHLDCIARNMNISYEWLLTGEGEMFLKPPPDVTNLAYVQPKPDGADADQNERIAYEMLKKMHGWDVEEVIKSLTALPRSARMKILAQMFEAIEEEDERKKREEE